MKRSRKQIADWKSPICRKSAVIALLIASPAFILIQILVSLWMDGVPETWSAIKNLFRDDSLDSVRRAWHGRDFYRQNTATMASAGLPSVHGSAARISE
jgi:hypothetical protein